MKGRSINRLTYEYIVMNCRDKEDQIETGFPLLNKTIQVSPGSVIGVSAVGAMGKTSFLLSILNNIVERYEDKPVLLVLNSHEGWIWTFEALLSIRSGIPRANIDEKDVLSSLSTDLYELSKKRLSVYEGPCTESELVELFDTEAEIIFIDDLQCLLSPSFDNIGESDFEDPPEEVDFSKLLIHIKQLAKDNNKTVFFSLSHPRIVDHYPDHIQRIEDLKVYGEDIGSLVDAILFPFRAAYYGCEHAGNDEFHLAELRAYVNGYGMSYVCNMKFNRYTCEFTPLENYDRCCEFLCECDPVFEEKYKFIYGTEDSDIMDASEGEISEVGFITLDDDEEIPF